MPECDARLQSSSLARGYTWFVRLHFPMLAYVHVLRYLRRCPSGGMSRRAWRVLAESCAAHAAEPKLADAIFVVCSRLILQGWDVARGEHPLDEAGPTKEARRIVTDLQNKTAQLCRPRGGKRQWGEPWSACSVGVDGHLDHGHEDIMGLQGRLDLDFVGYSEAPLLAFPM